MKRIRVYALTAALLALVGVLFWLRSLEQSYDQPYHLVEEGLYVGRAVETPPPGTQAVVNLCGKQMSYQVEEYLWEPVLEHGKEPTLDWLEKVVNFIDEQQRAGRVTYVHCLAGVNRSGTAVTAYLMQKYRWNRDQALAFVRSKRREIQPNPTMMKLLAEWENE